MITSHPVWVFLRGFALAGFLTGGLFAAAAGNGFIGRWALTIPGGAAGWLEVKQEKDWLDGAILWGGGSVVPVAASPSPTAC